jgi:hypothetical protein
MGLSYLPVRPLHSFVSKTTLKMLIIFFTGGVLYKLSNDYYFYSCRSNISLNQNSFQEKKPIIIQDLRRHKLHIALGTVTFIINVSWRNINI